MNIDQLTQQLGITLTDMQKSAAEAILDGKKDVVLLSPTGSGKTYAYLLPLFEQLRADADELQALVLVPGRELALQSYQVLQSVKTPLRGCACYGGRAAMDEHRILKKVKPQIIFGTPGRLIDHLQKGNISADGVRILVIDEFDKCLEMGFSDELSTLIRLLPHVSRRILLSATDAEEIPSFINLTHAQKLNFLPADPAEAEQRVEVDVFRSDSKDKLESLARLLCHLGQQSSIVFLNYRQSVERTAEYLRQQGFVLSAYHGGLDQKGREDALFRFANGSANVLVSTDLGSRGLDLPDVMNVIHYHLPETEDAYIHRVGRTARWKSTGRTIFLLGPDEQVPSYVDATVHELTIDEAPAPVPQPLMATVYIGKGKKNKISKMDIVGFLCKKGGLKGSEIGRIDVRDHYCYVAIHREKLASTLQHVRGEKIKGLHTIVEEIK